VDSVGSGCGPSPPAGAEGRGSPTSAGAPSPDRSHVIALSHGRTLTVRTARPEDLEGVRALYAGLSLDDRYHRFFSGAGTPAGYVEAWVHLPERGGVTLVAVVSTDTDRIVGEAGYALLGDGDGEFGITIAADWRGGLGPYLLDVLIEEAAARGVPNLQAEILTDNRAMLGLVWERGYAMLDHTDLASVRVTISTTGHTPSWPADDRRARVLVEMGGPLAPRTGGSRRRLPGHHLPRPRSSITLPGARREALPARLRCRRDRVRPPAQRSPRQPSPGPTPQTPSRHAARGSGDAQRRDPSARARRDRPGLYACGAGHRAPGPTRGLASALVMRAQRDSRIVPDASLATTGSTDLSRLRRG
jgi:hypothetical protein